MVKQSESKAYAAAGVDISAGYEAVRLMKEHISKTLPQGMSNAIGGFGGTFSISVEGMQDPLLVSGTDGVGTKIRLAQLGDVHHTIGIDCVAMCANDIICTGARPLFFLDYIACGKNIPSRIASIVEGVAEGCIQAECALVGGETAEHPDLMAKDDYDLAGFCVGIVDRTQMLDKARVKAGDVLLALPSTGVHSNGFSLVRHIFDIEHADLYAPIPELENKSFLETFLVPTAIYVKPIMALMQKVQPKSIAHITGGGFYENIPRALPEGLCVKIQKDALRILPLFDYIQMQGEISEHDMFNTFNMGVGMVVIVASEDSNEALATLLQSGIDAYQMGEVVMQNTENQVLFA